MLFEILLIIIGAIVALIALTVYILAITRRVVPPNYVDVVVDVNGKKMYSSDVEYSPQAETVYHEFPQWVPIIGKKVIRVPLEIIDIAIDDLTIFDSSRARFDCDLCAYVIVSEPIVAATRMPSVPEMEEQLKQILQATARGTSTQKTLQEIITNRADLVSSLYDQVAGIVTKWGLKLNNVELLKFKDSVGNASVTNLALQREKEIEMFSRQQIATNEKLATITEAESQEEAEKRVIQMEKAINIAEQEKERSIFEKEKEARQKEMEVEKVELVVHEQNVKEQKKMQGEGIAELAKGEADAKFVNIQKPGEAEANVHKLKLLAEAEGKDKIADAVGKFTELGKDVMVAQEIVEKDRQVNIETAKAFQGADIRVLAGGGDNSGFSLAGLLQSIKVGDKDGAKALLNRIARPHDLGFSSWDEMINSIDSPKVMSDLKKAIKKTNGGAKQ